LTEAYEYNLRIYRYDLDEGYIERVSSNWTTDSLIRLELPTSQSNEYYRTYLYGYSPDDVWVGQLMVAYDNEDYGYSYNFIMEEPVSGWSVPLNFTVAGYESQTTFGMTEGATGGFDADSGDELVSPPPPTGVTSYYYYPDNPSGFVDYRKLSTSYHAIEYPAQWTLHAKTIGVSGEAVLTWVSSDISQIPGDYFVSLETPTGSVDMREATSYTWTAEADISYYFNVTLTSEVEFTLNLVAGWNMVSMPVLPDDQSAASVLSDVGFYQLVTWSGSGYVSATSFEEGQGYWLLVLQDVDVTITGQPVDSVVMTLPPGWSMIGGPNGVVAAAEVFPGFYQLVTWSGSGYVSASEFEPGVGYWALVLEETMIGIGAPAVETVTIGDISSTTSGLESVMALSEIALSDINEYMESNGHPYRFEADIQDAEGQAYIHLEKVQYLASEGVDLVVGGRWSSQAAASLEYINENDMLILSPSSTSPILAIEGDNLFRLAPTDVHQTPAIAEMLWSYGIEAIAVIQRADAWADGIYHLLETAYPDKGGVIGVRIRYEVDTTDFSSYLTVADEYVEEMIWDYGADRVGVVVLSFSEAVTIVTQAESYANLWAVKWFGSDGTALTSQMIYDAPEQADHLKIFSTYVSYPEDSELFQSVNDRYYTSVGYDLSFYSAAAYDAYWVYALSVLEAGSSDAMDVKAVLPDVASTYQGASGLCTLDAAGDRTGHDYDIWGYGLDDYGDGEHVKYGTYDGGTDTVTWDTDALGFTPPGPR